MLEGSGCGRIIINHCPTGYPAKLTGINLRVLTTPEQLFPIPWPIPTTAGLRPGHGGDRPGREHDREDDHLDAP